MALLRVETERRLADFFNLTAQGEREIELARIALSENRDFEPYSAFKILDRYANGFVNYLDFIDFLERNRIPAPAADVELLIRQYDSDSDGRLSLTEFQQLVLPSTSLALRDIAISRPPVIRLTIDVEFLLARLLDKELTFQRRLENSRRDLELSVDYTTLRAFDTVDYPPTSFITRDKIQDFLRRNLISAFTEDIDAILRRFDNDNDERLTYSEFSEAIKSTSPVSSIGISSSPTRSSPSRAGRHSSPLRRSSSPGRSPSRSFQTSSPSKSIYESTIRSPTRSSYYEPAATSSSNFRSSPSRSLLTPSEESELVSIFFQQINLDRDLESARRELALAADFTLIDAFNFFDLNNLGYITQFDFEDTVRGLGVRIEKDEVSLLFKHYTSSERRLTYTEFSKLLTTKDIEYARMISNRTPQNLPRHERRRAFRLSTESALIKTLKLHLENEIVAESLRQRLDRRPSFSLSEAFTSLDRDRKGYVTLGEFQGLLEDHGIFASRKDVQNLLERYDKDKDGRVSYSEFLDEVTPKSPRKY